MCMYILFQYCHVGRLSHEVGWKYQKVVETLERKRKVKTVLNMRKRDKLKVRLTTNKLYICFNCFYDY